MRCLIVDDEPLAREGLEMKVQKAGFLDLVGIFSGGIEANQFLAANEVDLLFLDIQMPDLTGLELLRTMQRPPLVIFTTAWPEHALEGYQFPTVDYLLKPIEFSRFMAAANKAQEIWKRLNAPAAAAPMVAAERPDFIFLRADRQFIKVFLKDIRYLEGMKNYAMVHTTKEKFMTAISLQQIMEQLPDDLFGRINKSFIVNVQLVRRVHADYILMENGAELPFGKSFQEDFIARFVKGSLLERK